LLIIIRGYYFYTPNVTDVISQLIIADIVIGGPVNWVIDGLKGNEYVVSLLDGSGMSFIGTSINKIKNTSYPRNMQISGIAADVPIDGQWSIGDTIIDNAPVSLGYGGFKCVSPGIPGTWKGFGQLA